MRLINRTEIERPAVTYNLHVEKNNNYVANGVVVSNCHGSKASILQELMINYASQVPHRFGLTGTMPPHAVDKLMVHCALGEIIAEVPAAQLIDKNWLAVPTINITQLNDEAFLLNNDIKELDKLLFEEEQFFLKNNTQRLQATADIIIAAQRNAKVGNVLVLVNNVTYGRDLAKLLPNAHFLSGTKSIEEREDVYNLYEHNDNVIAVCTKQIAGVGLSINRIFVLVYIDIGKSFINVIQAIGRGLRKGHDKETIDIYDICSNLRASQAHLAKRITYYKRAKYKHTKKSINYITTNVTHDV
jgi:superfamily II DNA or RNA helicase